MGWVDLSGGWENQETLPEDQERSVDPSGAPRGVGRPSWRAGGGCEALPEGRAVSEGPPGRSGGVGSPIRMARALEALAKGPEGVGSL